MNKTLVSHTEFIQHIFILDKTEMEESETEGSAQLVNNTVLDIGGLSRGNIEICGGRKSEREVRDFVYLAIAS